MKITLYVYIFILAVIIFLSDWNGTAYLLDFVMYVPFGDKIGHFLLFGFFSLMLNLALKARTFRIWRINFLLGTLIVLIVVFVEEFSQIFIRGRSFDYRDLIADFAGIIIFGEIARIVCGRFFKKEN